MCCIVHIMFFSGGDEMNGEKRIDCADIGARIREARNKLKMSQADVAEKAGVALSHYTNIENGKVMMKMDTFVRILEILQVSADWVLRANIPESSVIFDEEYLELLDDCSVLEKASIVAIAKEVKKQIRVHQTNDE